MLVEKTLNQKRPIIKKNDYHWISSQEANQRLILCNALKSQNKKTKENIDFLTEKNPREEHKEVQPG